jgi:L-methionine (R)-S-oxide reductase
LTVRQTAITFDNVDIFCLVAYRHLRGFGFRDTIRKPSGNQGRAMISDNRKQLVNNIKAAIADKQTETDILKTAARLIDDFSEGYNWTGFYLMRGDMLEVGPYIGPETPHKRIKLRRGICGAAASEKRSIVVDDTNADPRFLACASTTQSEVVVPLMDGDACLGGIDIDSDQLGFFNSEDREMLEAIAGIIVQRLKEIR